MLPAMRNTIVLTALATFTMIGCSKQLDEQDSRVAFAAAFGALGTGAGEAQLSAGGAAAAQASDTPSFRAGAAGAVDYTFNCQGGGSIHFAGNVTAVANDTGGYASFNFSTDYASCSFLNITMDGSVDYVASASGTADTAKADFSIDGSLSFSGEVDGDCDFDLTYSLSATQNAANISYSGSICGHDAAATLNVSG